MDLACGLVHEPAKKKEKNETNILQYEPNKLVHKSIYYNSSF